MKIKEFKIRASQIGQIMTDPKTKAAKEAGELSETAKSYCKTWLKEQIYSRKKEFSTKFTEKGNVVEDNSIDFIAEQLGLGLLIKNQESFENEYITGTPDAIARSADLVIDAKNSWDCFSFPLFEDAIPTKDYYWQAQGYMNLTGLRRFRLCYVLSDTPVHLIEKEAYWWCKNNGYDDLDIDVYKEFEKRMTYSNISDRFKLKTFDVPYNQDEIGLVYNRVEKCREYINELKRSLKI